MDGMRCALRAPSMAAHRERSRCRSIPPAQGFKHRRVNGHDVPPVSFPPFVPELQKADPAGNMAEPSWQRSSYAPTT